MIFIELPIFTRCTEMLFSDADLRKFQNTILENHSVGTVIPGGKGLRKLRVPLPGRGKRSGARVIYYLGLAKNVVTWFTLMPKMTPMILLKSS